MKSAQLCDHVEILSGFAFKSNRFNTEGDGLPLVRIRDVKPGVSGTYYAGDYDDRFLVSNGDLLVGMDGEFNCARWLGGLALLNQRVCRVRSISPKLDEQYLYWFLPNALKEIEEKSNFVTVKHLSSKQIGGIEIPLPPLPEQKRIAAILDQADELRRKRQRAIDRLNQLGQAIFYEMFGDTLNVAPKTCLSDLVEEFRYGTSNKSGNGGYPTLRIPNVIGGEINLSDLKTVDVTDAEFRRLQMRDGDLLFVRTNGNPDNVGRCAVYDESTIASFGYDAGKFIYASYLIRARPIGAKLHPTFLASFLRTETGSRALRERSRTSAGQFNINTEGLGSIEVPLPPLEEQKSYAARIDRIKEAGASHNSAASKADALFCSLQSRAFRGEL